MGIKFCGTRLRCVREHFGLTQLDLALKIRVSVSTISKVETGSLSPSLSVLERLADALQVSPASFFASDGEPETVGVELSLQRRGDVLHVCGVDGLPPEVLSALALALEVLQHQVKVEETLRWADGRREESA